MKIQIAEKVSPFSKIEGTKVIVPETSFMAHVFPTKLIFWDMTKLKKKPDIDISIKLTGPLKNFIIFQNIEKSLVEVSGFTLDGFIKYKIKRVNSNIAISLEKCPIKSLEISVETGKENKTHLLSSKDILVLPIETKIKEERKLERLSLGMNKAQDIEQINRRENLSEILPLWFALGQKVPKTKNKEAGISCFLKICEAHISKGDKSEVEHLLFNIYKAGFSSLFSPMLSDEKYLGILGEKVSVPSSASPLILLDEGYRIVRSLFVSLDKNIISLLPCLLPIFHCGRMLNIKLSGIGSIDIEWSKKLLKKVILTCDNDTKIAFKLQSKIKSFRIKNNRKGTGNILLASDSIEIKKGRMYFLDRFIK